MITGARKSALAALRHDLSAHPALRFALIAIGATGAFCWGSFIFGRCTASRPATAPNLRLSSTVIRQESSLAVINERPLRSSDTLTAGDQTYRVVGISPGQVQLLRDDGTTIDLTINSGYALPRDDEACTSLEPFGQHAQRLRQ